jgi:RNA polymerase sigma factor (sigma-70 family)
LTLGALAVPDAISLPASHGRGARPFIDDATLIAQSWREPGRSGEIFCRHGPELHRYVARRLSPSVADDIVAETFLRAFRSGERYDVSFPDARPWLWRIASNLVRQLRRAEVRLLRALARTGVDPVLEGSAAEVPEHATAQAAPRQLAAALAGLSERDRDVLLLVAWGELTYEEVAAVLEIPVRTVRSRLNRARRKLGAALAGAIPTSTKETSSDG